MQKINLPVMILRGIVVLPFNEIRLEFDNEISKNIVNSSEYFHDNQIFIVTEEKKLSENPDIEQLPKIGVVARISHKVDLPKNTTRILLTGLYRAKVVKYLDSLDAKKPIESIVEPYAEEKIDKNLEKNLIKKIITEVENYLNFMPYNQNNILPVIQEVGTLNKLTDLVPPIIGVTLERMQEYQAEYSARARSELVLEDLYLIKEMMSIETEIETKVRIEMEKNQKEYVLREKIKVIKEELGDKFVKEDEIEAIRGKIKKLKAPEKIINRLNSELTRYESLSPATPEINIVRTYIDWMLDLPWNKETKDNENLKEVKKELDKSHYGLEKVKTRIIEYLAVKKMTEALKGPILCLVGPPGVGKTSLAFSIADALNRKFVKMSVGGVNDESEIVGHRRTYLGAAPGRIIQSLKKAGSSNPIFLIDEIDKMTKDFKGDPASTFLEILDPEQNKYFSDNYIEEEFNLSNVMFIATANYIGQIPEALRDRLEIVSLSGYTEFEKLDIAKNHLMKKICKEHGIEEKNITITDTVLLEIIRAYTKEAGVRELERQLATIIRKIITNFVVSEKEIKKTAITKVKLETYLGPIKYTYYENQKQNKIGVVNGLAYTSYGGDTLAIEVNYFKGKGNLILTGKLGDVMKESAQIAHSYIKSNCKELNIDYKLLTEQDIHIHVPEGAVPKDGPSAGIALTTALISALKNIKIPYTLAMTGEITLRGDVLAIGGLKEKSIGASRAGIKTIIIPESNKKDLSEIPEEVTKDIKYICVKKYNEVFEFITK